MERPSMNKPVKISVVRRDVTEIPADLLLLKYARSFHGADQTVSCRLVNRGVCEEQAIAPGIGEGVLVNSQGAISARHVLFLGTPRLGKFRYKEMRAFARQAIEFIGERNLTVKTLLTTAHGAGYGLDIEEALQALVFGFQQGIATGAAGGLEEIVFAERNARRCDLLHSVLHEIDLVAPPDRSGPESHATPSPRTIVEPKKKKCVFVAMPFLEEFEDVYQFGIYSAVRRCGYVCEKVDESVFAGSIVDRITDGISHSEFIIADLTLEKPNVYLEVGYAWGLQKPVIMIAKEGQRLHFDLAHHKCIFYRTIGRLSEELSQTIRDMFGCSASE